MIDDLFDQLCDLLDGRRYSNYFVACCPFHEDHSPSFFVYEDGFFCKSCGKSGKLPYLFKVVKGTPAKITRSQEKKGWYSPFSYWMKNKSLLQVCRQAHHNLMSDKSLASYLIDKRKLRPAYIKKLRIGYIDQWFVIPFFDQSGKIIGATARASEGSNATLRYAVPKNQDPDLLYIPDWQLVMDQPHFHLTFGIFDAITLAMNGIAAGSTTTGKRIDPSSLDDIRKVISIIPDKGEEEDGAKLAAKLGWRGRLVRPNWPDDCKDIGETWEKYSEMIMNMVK
jgi:CHC2 zinc finger